MGEPVWTLDPFDALDASTLERLLRARQAVFVVEQRCLYVDVDGRDPACWHLAAWPAEGAPRPSRGVGAAVSSPPALPLALARLLPPGLAFERASIGRVLTCGPGRSTGLGRTLVALAVQSCEALWPGTGQSISAQHHLVDWYAGFGFEAEGEVYDEDGIPHQVMHRAAGPLRGEQAVDAARWLRQLVPGRPGGVDVRWDG